MKYYCYILFSQSLNKFYIGSTGDPVSDRIIKHNSQHYGKRKFTSKADDWELFLEIVCQNRRQAELIEKHIKKMKSRVYITNLKVHPEIQENLLKRYS